MNAEEASDIQSLQDVTATTVAQADISAGKARFKVQSAVEFLSVYGFALLALGIIAALIYFFIAVPNTAAQNQCYFPANLKCEQISISSNSISTSALFVMVNTQQYEVANVVATINITGVGSYGGTCIPNTALPGGILECAIGANTKISINRVVSGNLYVTETVCTMPTQTGCSEPVRNTYGGTFVTHIVPAIS